MKLNRYILISLYILVACDTQSIPANEHEIFGTYISNIDKNDVLIVSKDGFEHSFYDTHRKINVVQHGGLLFKKSAAGHLVVVFHGFIFSDNDGQESIWSVTPEKIRGTVHFCFNDPDSYECFKKNTSE